jgi:peroxiredoxin
MANKYQINNKTASYARNPKTFIIEEAKKLQGAIEQLDKEESKDDEIMKELTRLKDELKNLNTQNKNSLEK